MDPQDVRPMEAYVARVVGDGVEGGREVVGGRGAQEHAMAPGDRNSQRAIAVSHDRHLSSRRPHHPAPQGWQQGIGRSYSLSRLRYPAWSVCSCLPTNSSKSPRVLVAIPTIFPHRPADAPGPRRRRKSCSRRPPTRHHSSIPASSRWRSSRPRGHRGTTVSSTSAVESVLYKRRRIRLADGGGHGRARSLGDDRRANVDRCQANSVNAERGFRASRSRRLRSHLQGQAQFPPMIRRVN